MKSVSHSIYFFLVLNNTRWHLCFSIFTLSLSRSSNTVCLTVFWVKGFFLCVGTLFTDKLALRDVFQLFCSFSPCGLAVVTAKWAWLWLLLTWRLCFSKGHVDKSAAKGFRGCSYFYFFFLVLFDVGKYRWTKYVVLADKMSAQFLTVFTVLECHDLIYIIWLKEWIPDMWCFFPPSHYTFSPPLLL